MGVIEYMQKRYNTKGRFRFFPVGQGMFYGGRVSVLNSHNSVNFAYDCGALNDDNGSILNNAIENSKDFFHMRLDMLFVSHFDMDHVNGIPSLLKTLEKSTRLIVVLPYFTPEELLVFQARAAIYISENENTIVNRTEIGEFLSSPYLYFLQQDHVVKVYVLFHGTKGEPFDNDQEVHEPLIVKQFLRNKELEGKLLYSFGSDKNKNEMKKRLRVVDKLLEIRDETGWYWKAIVPPAPSQKSMIDFKNELQTQNLLKDGHFAWERFSACCENNKAIKAAYQKIIKDINLTSLIVAHAPIAEECSTPATVLFGDTNLNRKRRYKYFVTKLKSELENARFLSVPHHGSQLSWNKEILSLPRQNAFWIVSAKMKNDYHHPHRAVICDFLHCQAPHKQELCWCNEEAIIDMKICSNAHCTANEWGWTISANNVQIWSQTAKNCKYIKACCALICGC